MQNAATKLQTAIILQYLIRVFIIIKQNNTAPKTKLQMLK